MASSQPFDARQGASRISADLQGVAEGVHLEFDTSLDPDAVEECLDRVGATFDHAKVRSFVPLLVRRYVRDELQGRLRQAQAGFGASSHPYPGGHTSAHSAS